MGSESKQDNLQQQLKELSERYNSAQTHHGELEKQLSRTIIRLALASSGLNSTLDPHLKAILNLVRQRQKGPDFAQSLVTLSKELVRFDDGEPQNGGGAVSNDPFVRLLIHQQLRSSVAEPLRILIEKLLRAPGEVSNQQLDQFVELLLAEGDRGASTEWPGFLGRLFEKKPAKRDVDADKDANQQLLALLERLSWPGQMSEDIARLEQTLARSEGAPVWIDVLEELSNLVTLVLSRIQTEAKSTEGFLAALAERLREIDNYINNVRDRRVATLDGFEALNTGVNGELTEMQTFTLQQQVVEAHHRANTDAVTGLPNRLAYEERLPYELA
ncbi:MAG: GGDEF domain-containing protein, partial [Gammaproteobacteria bacterium]|nr:GGDEF domain-containing protein [Gammaproteobacteria bacterium]